MSREEVKNMIFKVINDYEETEKFELDNSEDSYKLATCLENYLDDMFEGELLEFYNTYQEHYGDENYIYENNSFDIERVFDSAWVALRDFSYYEASDSYFRLYPSTETIDYIPVREIFVDIFTSVLIDALLQEEDRVYDFNIIDLYLDEK